jgi:hypothetical protein
MTYALLALGIVGLVALALLVLAAMRAPLGYEDCDGFHEGENPEVSPTDNER